MAEMKLEVVLSEVHELLRLARRIESPTATFKRDDTQAMADEVIENSIHDASQMTVILLGWIPKA